MMAIRHRDMDERGKTALLGEELLATPGCRRWTGILHPRVQGMTANVCLCKQTQTERPLCLLMLISGALIEAGQI